MEIVIVAVMVIVSLAAVHLAHQSRSGGLTVKRQFGRTTVSRIRDVTSPGIVQLSGTVRELDDAPVSEASGRPYVARDMRITIRDGGDGAPTRPASNAVDFLLDDGTGVALVRARDAAVLIDRDFEAPRTTLDQVPWLDALLRAGGYHNGSPARCRIDLREGVLSPGAAAGVVGHAEPADHEARMLGATIIIRPIDKTRVAIRAT